MTLIQTLKGALLLSFAAASFGCATGTGALLLPSGESAVPASLASRAELTQVHADGAASHHLLRVERRQPPRSLPQHDLTLFVMGGRLHAKLDGRDFSIAQGDVVHVPRGTVVELENAGSQPALAYVVVTPPLAGAEAPLAGGEPPRQSSWHWTRWGR